MDEITISLDDSPIISQPSPVLIGDQTPVVVQENFVGGRSATIRIGTVETLPEGSEAYVQNVGTETDAIFNMGIPCGETGAAGQAGLNGRDGAAATIQIGTVSTGLPDTNASVTNVGTSSAAVLDFTIPRGSQGERGLQGVAGEDGVSPIAYVTQTSTGATIHIEDAQNTTDAVITNGTDGTDGTDGFSPIATVTQTSTGATVSITDAQGTTTANITNGVDGTNGTDGFSPIATVTQTSTGATVSITDAQGTTTANITNGTDGDTNTIKAGTTTIPALNAGSYTAVPITIPTQSSTNYSVVVTLSGSTSYWTWLRFTIANKTTTGFEIGVYNDGSGATGSVDVDYIVVKHF